jgi:hypothetical protein
MKKVAALLMLLMFVPDSMAQTAGWQQTWEETLAAAKKEGKVTVSGPPSQELRRALPAAFKERFGITLEYLGGRSSETATKLRVERQAGVHTVDVMIAGIQTMDDHSLPGKDARSGQTCPRPARSHRCVKMEKAEALVQRSRGPVCSKNIQHHNHGILYQHARSPNQ